MNWLTSTYSHLYVQFIFLGLQTTVYWRLLLWPWRSTLLRDPLPSEERFIVRWMPQTDLRTLRYCHVQEIPSWTFCLRLLLEAAEQGNVQGTERQALLSRLLWETLWINRREWNCRWWGIGRMSFIGVIGNLFLI